MKLATIACLAGKPRAIGKAGRAGVSGSGPSRSDRLGSAPSTGRDTSRVTDSGSASPRRRVPRSSTSARPAWHRTEVLPFSIAAARTGPDQGCGARTVDEMSVSSLQDTSTLADKCDSLRASWRISCGYLTAATKALPLNRRQHAHPACDAVTEPQESIREAEPGGIFADIPLRAVVPE